MYIKHKNLHLLISSIVLLILGCSKEKNIFNKNELPNTPPKIRVIKSQQNYEHEQDLDHELAKRDFYQAVQRLCSNRDDRQISYFQGEQYDKDLDNSSVMR